MVFFAKRTIFKLLLCSIFCSTTLSASDTKDLVLNNDYIELKTDALWFYEKPNFKEPELFFLVGLGAAIFGLHGLSKGFAGSSDDSSTYLANFFAEMKGFFYVCLGLTGAGVSVVSVFDIIKKIKKYLERPAVIIDKNGIFYRPLGRINWSDVEIINVVKTIAMDMYSNKIVLDRRLNFLLNDGIDVTSEYGLCNNLLNGSYGLSTNNLFSIKVTEAICKDLDDFASIIKKYWGSYLGNHGEAFIEEKVNPWNSCLSKVTKSKKLELEKEIIKVAEGKIEALKKEQTESTA